MQLKNTSEKETNLLPEILEFAKKLGYKQVKSLEYLNIAKEEIKKTYAKELVAKKPMVNFNEDEFLFLKNMREDGTEVKIIILVQCPNFIGAIFSPVYYEGLSSNHDFSVSEIKNSLKYAMEGKVYRSPEK